VRFVRDLAHQDAGRIRKSVGTAAPRHAARKAAFKEARFQLDRLAAVNLDLEPPEYRNLARSWMRRLHQAIEPNGGAGRS
jgi:hypothetical protein